MLSLSFRKWKKPSWLLALALSMGLLLIMRYQGLLIGNQFNSPPMNEITNMMTIPIAEKKLENITTSTIYYTNLRWDQSGSVINDLLMAHAYVYSKQSSFGGGCAKEPEKYQFMNDYIPLIENLGLSDVLPIACPKKEDDWIFLNAEEYRSIDTAKIFTDEWLRHIRTKIKYNYDHPISSSSSSSSSSNNNGTLQISIHIRRGDVSPCTFFCRYLPNSHYMKIIDNIVNHGLVDQNSTSITNYNIKIHSQRKSFESWKDFEMIMNNNNSSSSTSHASYQFEFDRSLVSTWNDMLNADVLVMSKSYFSVVPAILSRGVVIYTRFWMKPLPQWKIWDLAQEDVDKIFALRKTCKRQKQLKICKIAENLVGLNSTNYDAFPHAS